MLVGLVSDTHDNHALTRHVVSFFRERAPDAAFHLGDITTPSTVRMFRGLPMRFLCGNNDVSPALGPALAECGFPTLAPAWSGEMGGVRVGATHGHLRARLRQLRGACDVVLHGHTHKRRAAVEEGTLMVNPGALYRVHARTIALLHLPEKRVEFFEVGSGGVAPLPEGA